MARSSVLVSAQAYREQLEREAEAERVLSAVRAGVYDYDPVVERVGLLTWQGESVDEFGEVRPGRWSVELSGKAKRLDELHDWGVLLFGPPPWRRSCVIRVSGRLGSLEAAAAALPAPAAGFEYAFDYAAPVPGAAVAAPESLRGGSVRGLRLVQGERVRRRAAVSRQGSLF